MKILVVGCERSGTKMLAAKLGDENQVEFSLENNTQFLHLGIIKNYKNGTIIFQLLFL